MREDASVFETQFSQKPRNKTITYTIDNDDTLKTIAQKFSISENTIRWENNLTDDTLKAGQTLQILPVTGVSHIVVAGDTVQSLAQQYKTDPQKIIDYPYNNYVDTQTFTLITGEKIIIPDGKK